MALADSPNQARRSGKEPIFKGSPSNSRVWASNMFDLSPVGAVLQFDSGRSGKTRTVVEHRGGGEGGGSVFRRSRNTGRSLRACRWIGHRNPYRFALLGGFRTSFSRGLGGFKHHLVGNPERCVSLEASKVLSLNSGAL